MNFIMFCGNDRVGKSTMAQSLQKVFSDIQIKSTILSFSDSLRDELVDLYGIPEEIIWNKSIDKKNTFVKLGDYIYDGTIPQLWQRYNLIPSVLDYSDVRLSLRDLFVTHGTKIRRQENDLYWNIRLHQKLDQIDDPFIIIDDPRSPSDFEFDAFIFLLDNELPIHYNLEQKRFNDWLNVNKERISLTIKVPVPLKPMIAKDINEQSILPYILDKMPK